MTPNLVLDESDRDANNNPISLLQKRKMLVGMTMRHTHTHTHTRIHSGSAADCVASTEQYIANLPENLDTRQRLSRNGYLLDIWKGDLAIKVQTEQLPTDINEHKAQLISCLLEYDDVVRMALSVHEQTTTAASLFKSHMSVDELTSNRRKMVRYINEVIKRLLGAGESDKAREMTHAKANLLEREGQLQQRYLDATQRKPEKVKFLVRVLRSFFSCAASCGFDIPGCYVRHRMA